MSRWTRVTPRRRSLQVESTPDKDGLAMDRGRGLRGRRCRRRSPRALAAEDRRSQPRQRATGGPAAFVVCLAAAGVSGSASAAHTHVAGAHTRPRPISGYRTCARGASRPGGLGSLAGARECLRWRRHTGFCRTTSSVVCARRSAIGVKRLQAGVCAMSRSGGTWEAAFRAIGTPASRFGLGGWLESRGSRPREDQR